MHDLNTVSYWMNYCVFFLLLIKTCFCHWLSKKHMVFDVCPCKSNELIFTQQGNAMKILRYVKITRSSSCFVCV